MGWTLQWPPTRCPGKGLMITQDIGVANDRVWNHLDVSIGGFEWKQAHYSFISSKEWAKITQSSPLLLLNSIRFVQLCQAFDLPSREEWTNSKNITAQINHSDIKQTVLNMTDVCKQKRRKPAQRSENLWYTCCNNSKSWSYDQRIQVKFDQLDWYNINIISRQNVSIWCNLALHIGKHVAFTHHNNNPPFSWWHWLCVWSLLKHFLFWVILCLYCSGPQAALCSNLQERTSFIYRINSSSVSFQL